MPIKVNMPVEEYHLDPSLSASGVKTIAQKSLAHFKGAQRKNTTAFDVGTAAHTFTLEPEHSSMVWCGPETRRGSEWKDLKKQADEEGALLLTEGDYRLASDMAEAVRSNAAAASLLTGDLLVEASVFSQIPVEGVKEKHVDVRCRPDGWRRDIAAVIDLKTTLDPSPAGFAKSIANFGYHIQEYFYRAVMAQDGHEVDRFVFIAVGKEAPHLVGIYELDAQSLTEGQAATEYALSQYARARETGVFGYDFGELQTLQLPRWAFQFSQPDGV